jgi:GNAT superfamily N-acetyltransferase
MEPADVEPLTDLWAQGWRDGHVGIVPEALTRLRNRDSFRDRLRAAPQLLHLIGPVGAPTGFLRLKGAELDQFYVHPATRGTGLAQRLMTVAEARMKSDGHRDVWLACSVGNTRAARFYTKCGWQNAGVIPMAVETAEGPFTLDVWRMEKTL